MEVKMSHTTMQKSGCLRLVSLVACSSLMTAYPFAGHARGLAEIKNTKELRICIAFVNSAMGKAESAGCRDNCKVSGDTPDLGQTFASTLGPQIKPKWLSVGWEEQFFNRDGKVVQDAVYTPELLASGTCDLYATNLAKIPWRSKKFDYVILNPSRMAVVVVNQRQGPSRPPKTSVASRPPRTRTLFTKTGCSSRTKAPTSPIPSRSVTSPTKSKA